MERYYKVTILKGKQPLYFASMTMTLPECKVLDECLMPDCSLQIESIPDDLNNLFVSLLESEDKLK